MDPPHMSSQVIFSLEPYLSLLTPNHGTCEMGHDNWSFCLVVIGMMYNHVPLHIAPFCGAVSAFFDWAMHRLGVQLLVPASKIINMIDKPEGM